MTNERCPICYVMSLKTHTDENEKSHGHCTECGYNTDADGRKEIQLEDWELENRRMQAALEQAEAQMETPLGQQIEDSGEHEAFHSHFDDDPNPYAGTYSEE